VTKPEGADNVALHVICDQPIADQKQVLKIVLDWAAIKRPTPLAVE
jgi:hypothetical protein